jgi:hypothetical protein
MLEARGWIDAHTTGHNKWICGFEYCMYVWERLHVHGRRISGRARRRRKFTDSHPFIYKNIII